MLQAYIWYHRPIFFNFRNKNGQFVLVYDWPSLQNKIWIFRNGWRVCSAYINLFLTWHNAPIYDDKKMIFTNRLCACQLCLHCLDDITIYCWWHHIAIMWPNNCDAIMWKVISNSFDIHLIHGNIHSCLCKELCTWFVFVVFCCGLVLVNLHIQCNAIIMQ